MERLVYKRTIHGRYSVYVGRVRLGWVIRRPDGWLAISPASGKRTVPTVRGAPAPTRKEAAGRLLATDGPVNDA